MARGKALAALALALAVSAAVTVARSAPQGIQHQTSVLNIEIPVRVFKGDVFVDDLTIADFEVLEDGRPQKVEAAYLVKKTIIERREEARDFSPPTSRHFFLFFELDEYDAKVLEALDYFVRTVLLPGDNLILVTPMKTYRMRGELFAVVGRDRTYAQVTDLLRRDIEIGYSESRAILAEMTDLARVMASDVRPRDAVADAGVAALIENLGTTPVESAYQGVALEEQLMHYRTLLERLGSLRVVDETKLRVFADHLKRLEGQKGVFFFYQREFIPAIDPRLVDLLNTKYSERPDISQALDTIFGLERRKEPFDVDIVTKAFSDASAMVHFLYVAKPAERVEGIRMEERSEDIFGPFREMAKVTGGTFDSSANIAAAMRTAVKASENYYLLYYTPAGYRTDGRFRRLTVKVRNGPYRVSHRLGYFAD